MHVNWSRQSWRRLAIGAWLACTIVTWNVVFDRGVESAEQHYLERATHAVGRAPAVSIKAAMQPAIHRAATGATEWAAIPLLVGLVLMLIVASSE